MKDRENNEIDSINRFSEFTNGLMNFVEKELRKDPKNKERLDKAMKAFND
jgi:hypothetical protein